MDFIDEAKITIRSGHGGKGSVSFRREKYIPKGGPDGGDGGKGGNIIFKVNPNLSTLQDFKYRRHYLAKDGRPGDGQQKTGRSSEDLCVEVPLGTLIRDEKTGKLLMDLHKSHHTFIAAKGGKGGRGNLFFKSSTNQAPQKFEKGIPGEEITLHLELKLLADIAIVGFPNAGKSTLLSAISSAHPKIADYPFTTLTPQLGVVELKKGDKGHHYVVADIPGIIEGAHEGKGLGLRFLKHLERSHFLWIVMEVFPQDQKGNYNLQKTYEILCKELISYKKELAQRPHFVVLTKSDVTPQMAAISPFMKGLTKKKIPYFLVSGKTKDGIRELLWQSLALLNHQKKPNPNAMNQ